MGLKQQLELAQFLIKHGFTDLCFLIISPGNQRFVFDLNAAGINHKFLVKPEDDALTNKSVLAAASSEPKDLPIRTSRFKLFHLAIESARSLKRIALRVRELRILQLRARKLLKELSPGCIITAQERATEFLPVLAECKKLKIPTLLLPAHALCNPDGGVVMRYKQKKWELFAGLNSPQLKDLPLQNWVAPILNRLISVFFPGQIFESKFGKLLIWPAEEIFALALSGLLPPNLWHHGTRFADRIVLSGNDEKTVCLDAGIHPEKLAVIGSISLDSVFETYSERRGAKAIFLTEHGLSSEKPTLILSLPPLYEHKMLDRAAHFESMRLILSSIELKRFSVVVSLHPKMNQDEYQWILEEFGYPFIKHPLKDILGYADFFVGAAYTSTLRWAMSLSIPSVNIDFWDLDDSTYRHIRDYPTVREFNEFEDRLKTYLNRPITQNVTPAPMGLIADGKFKTRFLTLLRSILSTEDGLAL